MHRQKACVSRIDSVHSLRESFFPFHLSRPEKGKTYGARFFSRPQNNIIYGTCLGPLPDVQRVDFDKAYEKDGDNGSSPYPICYQNLLIPNHAQRKR